MSDTLRLRKLQEPAHVSRLLDTLIVRAGLVPLGAYQVRAADSVPTELRDIARLASHSGRAWSCWAHGAHTWLFTGNMPLEASRDRGKPVLQVDAYEEARLKDAGLWTPDRDGTWRRCTD